MRVFVESTGFARLGPGRRSARPRGRDATWRWATAIARARPGWTRDARTRRPRQTRRARSRSPSTTRPFRVSPRRGDYLDEKRNPLPASNVVRGGRSIDPRRRRLDTILPRGSLRRARVLSRCAIRSCVRRVSLVRARASLRRARASRDEINSGWWVGIKSTPAWVNNERRRGCAEVAIFDWVSLARMREQSERAYSCTRTTRAFKKHRNSPARRRPPTTAIL